MQTETMEWTCNSCGGTGEVECPANKMEASILIVCSHCKTLSAYGWCDKNGVGDEITGIEFSKFQKTWQCIYCGSRHKLLKDFYETSVVFTPRRFLDLRLLQLENDIKSQKYLPLWARNILEIWKNKRIYYFMYGMLSVLILFVIAFVSFLIVDRLKISDPGLSLNMLYVSLGLLGLLIFIFFLNLLIELLFSAITNVFLIIYKFRKLRQ